MNQMIKKWGAICLILGSLLIGGSNAAIFFELTAETALMHMLVLWGHAFMAFGFFGLAVSIFNNENRTKVMGGTALGVIANVILAGMIGIMVMVGAGEIAGTGQELAERNAMVSANFYFAHFGYVIGLLILLTCALGHSAYSKYSLYLFIFATVVLGAGPFLPEAVFGTGFALTLIGGAWVGKELFDDSKSAEPVATAAAA